MRFVTTSLAAAAAVLLTSAVPAGQQTFRSGARTVAVYATVTGGDGRLVTDLTREDFEVRDNGKPQPITVFSSGAQPITVVVMLDRSGSMRGNFGLVQRAAEAFVQRLDPADKARIGAFADQITMQPEQFTGDRAALVAALRAEMPVTGRSPVWNAVDAAIGALAGQDGRRVVLIFSDGADAPMNFRFDNKSIMDVMRRAQQENVMVYAIGLQSTVMRGPNPRGGLGGLTGAMTTQRPDPGLATVADDTGGGYFELSRAEDLAATFAQVAEELHRQYALGFEPPALDGKMHKLEVKVPGRRGMKVRTRKEYFAAKP